MNSIDSQHDRNLLVIDDLKIRRDLFSTTSFLLKKIKKLLSDHEDFLAVDQKLYEDWFNLTFRNERKEAERIESRLQTLTTFKTHLLHISETSGISHSEAYRLLKDEELQYQTGDADWKYIIENLRKHRLEYAQKKSTENTSLFDCAEPHLRLNRKKRSLYYYCKEIPEETLRKNLANSETGYQLFKEIFQIAMECGDWHLLSRIWSNCLDFHKEKTLRTMPSHLMDFLLQMIAESSDESNTPEELKATFRKLVRQLHPDVQKGTWSVKMLREVHAAYEAKDLRWLKRLELITVVELGDLKSLTLDEIYESSLVFAEEFDKLKRRLKSFEKHPAWRFSSRRSYQTLTKRIRSDLEKSLAPKIHALTQLEEWLQQLEYPS